MSIHVLFNKCSEDGEILILEELNLNLVCEAEFVEQGCITQFMEAVLSPADFECMAKTV